MPRCRKCARQSKWRLGLQGNAHACADGIRNLEAGLSPAEITEVFDVTLDEINAVLHFATESLYERAGIRLMKILFDNGTPKPIARCLIGHEVTVLARSDA
jgi:hypothetical protein